jgi:hypothetical protein
MLIRINVLSVQENYHIPTLNGLAGMVVSNVGVLLIKNEKSEYILKNSALYIFFLHKKLTNVTFESPNKYSRKMGSDLHLILPVIHTRIFEV